MRFSEKVRGWSGLEKKKAELEILEIFGRTHKLDETRRANLEREIAQKREDISFIEKVIDFLENDPEDEEEEAV